MSPCDEHVSSSLDRQDDDSAQTSKKSLSHVNTSYAWATRADRVKRAQDFLERTFRLLRNLDSDVLNSGRSDGKASRVLLAL